MDLNKAKSKEQYDAILQENKDKYDVCPKCGGTNFTATISFINKREGFMDFNDCICFNCKSRHLIDQRVYIKQEEKTEIKKRN